MGLIMILTLVLSLVVFFIVVGLCIANSFGLLKTHVERPEVKKMFKISVVTLLVAVTGLVTASIRYFAFSTKPYLGLMGSITSIQKVLHREGLLRGSPESVLGPETFVAIREFQKANDLGKSDGAIDEETVDKLFNWERRASSPINKEDQAVMKQYMLKPCFDGMKEQVHWFQSVLKRAGCYRGNLDGILRPELLKAVTYFQYKKGITADGVFGPDTFLCAVEQDINRFDFVDFVSKRLKNIKD